MTAKETALKDIKKELDIEAQSDMIMRKGLAKVWLPFAHCYWYEPNDSWTLRISHLRNHKDYFNPKVEDKGSSAKLKLI